MNPFDIYRAEVLWKNCADMRPWLIVDVHGDDEFGCFPIASERYNDESFFIDQSHPDFPVTGLTKSCHVILTSIVTVCRDEFKQRRGMLTKNLLSDFRAAARI